MLYFLCTDFSRIIGHIGQDPKENMSCDMRRKAGKMAIIGIDLGTTNSLASVWKDGRIQLIPNSFGEYLTPSVVSFGDDGEVFVGKIAREMLVTRPERTFREFKRDMGTDKLYRVGDREYRPEELSAFVLRRLKEDAEAFLGEPVTEAVISVPAYFNDDKRCATKNAGKLAGLQVERLINEPSAVALKHHVDQNEMERFIIFDFGGGTLDVSLVDAFDNMVEIQAVSGDNYLGGKDFNEKIAGFFYEKNHLTEEALLKEERGIVLKEAEQLKCRLSEQDSASMTVLLQGREYTLELSNQELIHISTDLFTRMLKPIQKTLTDASAEWEEIDKIILVGGSSKMPTVAKYIKSMCRVEVAADPNPDESIAIGVGMAAAIKMRTGEVKDVILSDICPFSLGVDTLGDRFSPIIERNETLPTSRTRYYTTVKDYQRSVSFDIYQGESMVASENLKLGSITMSNIPPAPKGVPVVEVTFLYDINGILDIKCGDGNQTVHKLIVNKSMGLTEEELEKRLKELEQTTIHAKDQEQNRFLIEEAQRLYQECNPQYRERIRQQVEIFETMLERGSAREIREAYVRLVMFLQMLEANKISFQEFDESFWTQGEDDEP